MNAILDGKTLASSEFAEQVRGTFAQMTAHIRKQMQPETLIVVLNACEQFADYVWSENKAKVLHERILALIGHIKDQAVAHHNYFDVGLKVAELLLLHTERHLG